MGHSLSAMCILSPDIPPLFPAKSITAFSADPTFSLSSALRNKLKVIVYFFFAFEEKLVESVGKKNIAWSQ